MHLLLHLREFALLLLDIGLYLPLQLLVSELMLLNFLLLRLSAHFIELLLLMELLLALLDLAVQLSDLRLLILNHLLKLSGLHRLRDSRLVLLLDPLNLLSQLLDLCILLLALRRQRAHLGPVLLQTLDLLLLLFVLISVLLEVLRRLLLLEHNLILVQL